jgi:Rrf2 family cysteine metabolism transcriptional repressor
MKLSTRTRYGTRALVELAIAYPDGTVSVTEIAQRQRISPKYLERIMATLKAKGFIRAVRGVHGGYMLALPPDEISLSQVMEALEGSTAPVDCVDDPESCPMEDLCPVRDTWVQMKQSVQKVLEETTVRELAERKKRIAGRTG